MLLVSYVKVKIKKILNILSRSLFTLVFSPYHQFCKQVLVAEERWGDEEKGDIKEVYV